MRNRTRILVSSIALTSALACSDDPADPDDPIPVAFLTLVPDSATVTEGGEVQLEAILEDATGAALTGRSIFWTSASETVATVSESGLVSGVASGDAIVTATSEGVEGTAAITVMPLVAMEPVLRVIAEGLSQPTFLTSPPGDSDRLYVLERRGVIRIVEEGSLLETPFLDITSEVGCCQPGGAFSMAFHPDYGDNGLFYVFHYTVNAETRITEFSVGGDPDVADPGSASPILTIPQEASATHFGGQLAFGPLGYLWASIGDGSSGDDEFMNGQDSTNVYGSILRLDVDGGDPYAIPSDNPFVDVSEVPDEIWAFGFRNPWRMSFDRETGDLYISENGQDRWEEVNFQAAGAPGGQNYGWSLAEGNHCYRDDPCDMMGLTPPIHEVAHDETGPGCSGSIIGGYVYRGSFLPQLVGHYFYANFCTRTVNSFQVSEGTATDHRDWTEELGIDQPVSFGEDADGELYLMSLGDGIVYGIEGQPVS